MTGFGFVKCARPTRALHPDVIQSSFAWPPTLATARAANSDKLTLYSTLLIAENRITSPIRDTPKGAHLKGLDR